jgi:hypothetical protein
MQFNGLEPITDGSVEVRTPHGCFDLHNAHDLQQILIGAAEVRFDFAPNEYALEPSMPRLRLAFLQCRSMTLEGDILFGEDSANHLVISVIGYNPGRNGPDSIKILFENDASLSLVCGKCVASVTD